MPDVVRISALIDEKSKEAKPRAFQRMARQDDLMLALNYFQPGYHNEFHHHFGTSQSFLVIKGELTLRTRKDIGAPIEEFKLKEGDCCMMSVGEYYQLANEAAEPLVLYQAKRPTRQVQVYGQEPRGEHEYFSELV